MVKVCLSCLKRTPKDSIGEADGQVSHGFCPSAEGYPCKDIYLRWTKERPGVPLPDFYKEVMSCVPSGATTAAP